jgi:hypothetical protein
MLIDAINRGFNFGNRRELGHFKVSAVAFKLHYDEACLWRRSENLGAIGRGKCSRGSAIKSQNAMSWWKYRYGRYRRYQCSPTGGVKFRGSIMGRISNVGYITVF